MNRADRPAARRALGIFGGREEPPRSPVRSSVGAPLAGSSTIPIAVLSLGISARVAPGVVDRIGAAATLAIGMVTQGAGLLLLARVPADASYPVDILPASVIVGVGLGFAEVAVQIAAFAGIDEDEAGLAGGAIETSREMGGALGLAVLVSVALSGSAGATEAFHRSVIVAAVFAVASAVVALTLLRPTERRRKA